MGLESPPSDRHKSFNNNDELVNRFNSKSSEEAKDPINCKIYSVADLHAVTGRFDKKNLIGEGPIGCAYKAMFSNGEILAVKRLDNATESNSSEDFMDAVSGILRMRHPNVIELVGYCSEPGHHLLVYECLKNGSLYDCLRLSDDYSKPLTWNMWIKIANTKSANILDTEPNPNLTDSGLATFYFLTSLDLSRNVENGYNAPECNNNSTYTLKSDVYCLEVVMLELLTGLEQSLVAWVTPQLHDIDALAKMVDPALRGL
ncbi:protein STRUBBELIG-RECEPTOR FAMILY 5 isoform X1 [Cinnamomum micranthum f. kanehirae]|uniref:Protein STRUBBELIG-RECEPTOR FAMILY 5 isoform X1 n=1 Tax=Cinnamomum micranthum f. kanehirae TaxID=337451 RepID=A0A443NZX6_9MAGN|nr:protein STRUBBELIG-RECEPTOR FAMILY 5 isoform X1 [Cinnamomum micranthum f. kanehirae]